jgi:hypothetical protein
MVPTYHVVRFATSCHSDVQGVRQATLRQDPGVQVGLPQSFRLPGDRQHGRVYFGHGLEHQPPFLGRRFIEFRDHDVRNQGPPRFTPQQIKKLANNPLAIAWLPVPQASPYAGFQVEGPRVHTKRNSPCEADVASLELADGQCVRPGAALLERRGHDAVAAVARRGEDEPRVEIILADVVVFGQRLARGVLQPQVGTAA